MDTIGNIAVRKIGEFDPAPQTAAERQRLAENAAARAAEAEAQRALLAEYRAALAEAQPIGNTDKLTALVERLISDLSAARKEIADFEASWACP